MVSVQIKPRYNKQYQREYYWKNRAIILLKKRGYNHKNREWISEYHKNYHLLHKEELKRKNKERYRIRKNEFEKSDLFCGWRDRQSVNTIFFAL